MTQTVRSGAWWCAYASTSIPFSILHGIYLASVNNLLSIIHEVVF